MGQWMMLVLSRRYSTLPALISLMAWATLGVTVPALGEASGPWDPEPYPDGRPRPSCREWRPPRRSRTSSRSGSSDHVHITHKVGAPAARPRQPCHPWQRPAPGRSCRCRGGGRWHRGLCWSAWRESTPSFTCSLYGLVKLSGGGLDDQVHRPVTSYWAARSMSFALSTYLSFL